MLHRVPVWSPRWCTRQALWLTGESRLPQHADRPRLTSHAVSCPSRRHQKEADAVERSASDALRDSEKSLALVRTLVNREYKVKQLIGALKST